jgi:hypothetical protein
LEQVTGFGRLFFRARNPQALAVWYGDHLGVALVPFDYDSLGWRQEGGPSAFAPFPENTEYFSGSGKAWMVNSRVRHFDAMALQLGAAGVTFEIDPPAYPNGRFARLYHPEGTPIDLWEPAGRDAV